MMHCFLLKRQIAWINTGFKIHFIFYRNNIFAYNIHSFFCIFVNTLPKPTQLCKFCYDLTDQQFITYLSTKRGGLILLYLPLACKFVILGLQVYQYFDTTWKKKLTYLRKTVQNSVQADTGTEFIGLP